METRRLSYFVTVVDCGAITRAAAVLHLAQPALSQHVSALEQEFGQQLLLRSRKGVVPTPAGLALYRYAKGILRLEESARDEIVSGATSPGGIVTLGLASYSLASTMVVPILQSIRSQYPRIVTRVVETLTVIHSQALTMGQIDAALIYEPGPVRGVRFERLTTEELYLVAPRWQEIPGSTDHSVPLAALATAQFIMPNQTHTVRRSLEQAFAHAGLTLDVVVELDHTRPLAEAVELGLGMTVLPKAAAESMFPRDAVRLYRIVDPSLVTALALATPDGQPLSLAAEAALEVVRAAVLHRLGRA